MLKEAAEKTGFHQVSKLKHAISYVSPFFYKYNLWAYIVKDSWLINKAGSILQNFTGDRSREDSTTAHPRCGDSMVIHLLDDQKGIAVEKCELFKFFNIF
jgi:hypothetical protein